VTIADMNLATAEQEEFGPDGKKKRKHEDAHDEEHAEFDPNALREHEEVTKVRNILKVELGKHEMDTWYLNPTP
jgi:histone acetyltransferase MYST1